MNPEGARGVPLPRRSARVAGFVIVGDPIRVTHQQQYGGIAVGRAEWRVTSCRYWKARG